MSYKDGTWAQRFGALGDEAEAAFEAYAEAKGLKFVRFGLDRPPIHVPSVPAFIRFTPDYLTSASLIEVQGFGRDQKFKLKADKMAALKEWGSHHPVLIFAWDSTNERSFLIGLRKIIKASAMVPTGFFDDGTKPYFEFSAELLGQLESS